MPDKNNGYQKVGEGQHINKRLKTQSSADKSESLNNVRQTAIRSLLRTVPVSIDDKLATVKTAQYVDKDRFQNAFRSLMVSSKS